jgi:hypothetical protein
MKSGTVSQTILDDTQSGGPKERKIVYLTDVTASATTSPLGRTLRSGLPGANDA